MELHWIWFSVSLQLGSPVLDTALQVCLTRAEKRGRITSLKLLAILCLMQEPFGHLCCKGTLLTFNLSIRTSRSFSAMLVNPQPVLVHGIIASQVQDFVELCWVPVSPFLQPVEVSLNGSTTVWSMNIPLSFVSFADLLRVHSVPSSRSVMKMLNRTGLSTDPRGGTASDGPPAGLPATDHNPLIQAVQPTDSVNFDLGSSVYLTVH